ncbi:hypothetical protein DAPPUDRAFT_113416 [Daphnia pulex]|uniref:LEM domain-containing protein n=1 Tax=Daphnia pulex TaxID=6669 RepID=E9HEY7_DAPPU|nr:hypothetical protein DAPPUDRAFT_113416 [Daphnia pulex]|eukprot:EFX69703.1 hypothetical protein DAPPUDRAFT_113416 [Daphnia pulex]
MLTGAMPAIQEGVANLRTTIQNDVASKLRATEETIARTLATLRRESNTAQDVTATEQRESIRQITAQIVSFNDGKAREIEESPLLDSPQCQWFLFLHNETPDTEIKSRGGCPGPITPTTKPIYQRKLFHLKIEEKQAARVPSPEEEQQQQPEEEEDEEPPQPEQVFSEELQNILDNYPGLEDDIKIAKDLDRSLVKDFTSRPPSTPSREDFCNSASKAKSLNPRNGLNPLPGFLSIGNHKRFLITT